MEIVPNDPKISAEFEKLLDHPLPFTADELGQLKELEISKVQSIEELKHCVGLEHLRIEYSNLNDLNVLSNCTELRTLEIVGVPIDSMKFLRFLTKIEQLTIQFTFVEEAYEILSLERIKSAQLQGNPWKKDFYLKLESYQFEAINTGGIISISARPIWEFAMRVKEFGVLFSYVDVRPFLVRPGIPQMPYSECDFIRISIPQMNYELQADDFSIDELFSYFGNERAKEKVFKHFPCKNRREVELAEKVSNWIDSSSLTSKEKNNAVFFVHSFRNCPFFRENRELIKEKAEKLNITFPEWYYTVRTALTFVYPEYLSNVHFSGFSQNQEFYEFVAKGWFDFDLGKGGEDNVILDGSKKLLPIGFHSSNDHVICMNLIDDDKVIYQYNQESLIKDNELKKDSAYPIFNSYMEMLAHIDKIELEMGKSIERLT